MFSPGDAQHDPQAVFSPALARLGASRGGARAATMEVLAPPPAEIMAPNYRGYATRSRSASRSPPPEPTGAAPPEQASPPPPSAFELLTQAAPLGSGGYGTVVQARHLILQKFLP